MIPRLTGSTFWKANNSPADGPPTRLVGVANVVLPSLVPCEPVAVPGANYSPPPWDGSIDRRPDQGKPTKRNQSTKHGNLRINCNQKTIQSKIITLNFQLSRIKQNVNDLKSKTKKSSKKVPQGYSPPVPGIPLHAL